MADIKLGNELRDVVTGFRGIATSRLEYLNGCVQYCVRPYAGDDGKYPEGEWIDSQQLEVIGSGVVKTLEGKGRQDSVTGGPVPGAPKRYAG